MGTATLGVVSHSPEIMVISWKTKVIKVQVEVSLVEEEVSIEEEEEYMVTSAQDIEPEEEEPTEEVEINFDVMEIEKNMNLIK